MRERSSLFGLVAKSGICNRLPGATARADEDDSPGEMPGCIYIRSRNDD